MDMMAIIGLAFVGILNLAVIEGQIFLIAVGVMAMIGGLVFLIGCLWKSW